MEDISTELIREVFPDKHIKKLLFGAGWRITGSDGSEVEIESDGSLKAWCGGPEIHRGVVLLAGRIWGHLEVSGSDDFVLSCMQWGERLNITVVPLVKDSGEGCLRVVIGVMVIGTCGILAGIFIDKWILAAPVILIGTWLIDHCVEKAMHRQARRAGQKYRTGFPASHDERSASIQEAQKRGYL